MQHEPHDPKQITLTSDVMDALNLLDGIHTAVSEGCWDGQLPYAARVELVERLREVVFIASETIGELEQPAMMFRLIKGGKQTGERPDDSPASDICTDVMASTAQAPLYLQKRAGS